MKIRVLCLMVDGFEEIELITPVDLLRRAGIEVVVASLGNQIATGRNGIRVEANVLLENADFSEFDLLMIPGGPGVEAMRVDGRAAKLAREFSEQRKWIAAICAAPLVLMDAGLLEGWSFTAHQSARGALPSALDERVVVDGNIITSRGAGTALDFGLTLVTCLLGKSAADEVAASIMA